jgi:hypothetical protein
MVLPGCRLPLSPASHLYASSGRGAQALPPLGYSTATLEAVTSALTTWADRVAGHSLLFCRVLTVREAVHLLIQVYVE